MSCKNVWFKLLLKCYTSNLFWKYLGRGNRKLTKMNIVRFFTWSLWNRSWSIELYKCPKNCIKIGVYVNKIKQLKNKNVSKKWWYVFWVTDFSLVWHSCLIDTKSVLVKSIILLIFICSIFSSLFFRKFVLNISVGVKVRINKLDVLI